MENKRWRIIEVELEHNHLIHLSTEKFYKSHRNNSSESKRPLQMTGQVGIDGSVITYIVKEREVENVNEAKDYEVTFNTAVADVLCACGLFKLEGFLCRHTLSQNGFKEIPPHYIFSRWRKDIHRSYVLDYSCNFIDTKNPVHRYDNLYKCAVKLVEEGRKSHERYKFTLELLGEILNQS
ncbi:hypothetical protein KY290_017549 [Solanum tuberosum]|uniref:Protein FAR1-RELATED SEQUENCE n=1 Tax=Solanum tuberosum TaxID=4113 RepID=A0ABQ7VBV2_SOLTU|nr:hypothetical protein KY290_017549 [Solanum tuberosum]